MAPMTEYLNCPYVPAHRIKAQDMPKHIFKCRKNHPSVQLATCPFNEIHRIPMPEMKFHMANCEYRASVELYKYCISTGPANQIGCSKHPEPQPASIGAPAGMECYPEPTVKGGVKSLLDEGECWDNADAPSYNPEEYCKKANVVRKATLMRPSEKRQFYRDEYQRLKDFRTRGRQPSFALN